MTIMRLAAEATICSFPLPNFTTQKTMGGDATARSLFLFCNPQSEFRTRLSLFECRDEIDQGLFAITEEHETVVGGE